MKKILLEIVQEQLTELENKMLSEVENRQPIFKDIRPGQTKSAQNLIHYLVLRNEDIRKLQDSLHIYGLSSLASSEGQIHSQLQSILQRLGKNYTPKELDSCNYEYTLEQMQKRSRLLFGQKADPLIPYIMVTFDSDFADNYAVVKNLLQNGMNVHASIVPMMMKLPGQR